MKKTGNCKILVSLICMTLAGYVYAQSQPRDTGSHSTLMFVGSTDDEPVANTQPLSEQVRAALVKAPNLDVSNILVNAQDGKVVLTGTAPDESQIAVASETAKSVKGVASVENQLTVRQP